jgi:hypothetical protein
LRWQHARDTLFKIESSSIRMVFEKIGRHNAWPDKELYAMGLEVTPNVNQAVTLRNYKEISLWELNSGLFVKTYIFLWF